MFILFSSQTGILHISLYPLEQASILRGSLNLCPDKPVQFDEQMHYFSTPLFKINAEKILPDFRTTIKSLILKKGCVFLILLLNKPQKIKKLVCLLSVFALGLLLLSLPNGVHKKSSIEGFQFEKWGTQNWIDYFNKTSLAKKISVEKNQYYSGIIPKIKGITSFRVIPLGSQEEENTFYLAVNFQKIITIQSEDQIFYKQPLATCSHAISLFQIDSKDKVIVIDLESKEGPAPPKEEFYLFPQNDFGLDSICHFFQNEVTHDK